MPALVAPQGQNPKGGGRPSTVAGYVPSAFRINSLAASLWNG